MTSPTAQTTWRFEPVDTLFFRDSRPYNLSSAAVLGSLFPPSARTVAGAVRFLIGNAFDADWRSFAAVSEGGSYPVGDGDVDLMQLMGRYDDYGSLRFSGPWLAVESGAGWRRLYPAPRHLLTAGDRVAARVEIGPAVACDLGLVRLPRVSREHRPAEKLWLDAEALGRALAEEVPEHGVHRSRDLFDEEPRLGIGRNLDRFSAEAGMLYQTRHVRARVRSANAGGQGPRCLAIEIGVASGPGMPERFARLVKLGGEGRLASVSIDAAAATELSAPRPGAAAHGLVLALLTPLPYAAGGDRWLPPGFERRDGSGRATVWVGTPPGIRLAIHTGVLGKAQREGGWDLALRRPRPVRGLVPAGSVYFATVHDANGRTLTGEALAPAIQALHLAQLADDPLGYGRLAVGTFGSDVFPGLDSFHLDPT